MEYKCEPAFSYFYHEPIARERVSAIYWAEDCTFWKLFDSIMNRLDDYEIKEGYDIIKIHISSDKYCGRLNYICFDFEEGYHVEFKPGDWFVIYTPTYITGKPRVEVMSNLEFETKFQWDKERNGF